MRLTPRTVAASLFLLLSSATALLTPYARGGHPQELEQLQERLREECSVWRKVYREAENEEARAALRLEFPLADYVGELTELAARAADADMAARAWLEVYRLGVQVEDRPTFQRAIDRLTSDCLASPELAGFALELAYGAPSWGLAAAQDALRRILAGTRDAGTRATAMAQLALLVGLDETQGDAGRVEARALLERIRAEFGSADFIGMKGEEFVAGALHEIEHLRVGQVAPDFELPDQDGVRFRLSDSLGKIVLLDFWGFV